MKARQTTAHYLPRLSPEHYQADAIVHWTHTTRDRSQLPLDELFHWRFREVLLHVLIRHGLLCPVYCLMPDHFHILWMGLLPGSDQRNATAFFRTHLRPLIAPLRWQPQAHDRVLRSDEGSQDGLRIVVAYDLLNPVRGELREQLGEWPWTGCMIPGFPRLHPLDPEFWERFWAVYVRGRDPACDRHVRPPR